jgi:hypothetical protein
MNRVSLCLGVLVLLIVLVAGACAATRLGATPARSPKSPTTCIACKGASDCGGYQSCSSGCCTSVDDENPLEQ